MSTEPLDEIQWKNPEWIQQFGLHSGNVLDYFGESPFYDRTSNNQVLKMQFQFQPPPNNISPQQYFELKLKEMTGIEFIIAYVREPDFWIIRKQKRLDLENTLPKQDYYIIGANVYQAPKIYDILSSRLLSSVLSIKKSIDLLNKLTKFSIQEGVHSNSTLIEEGGSINKLPSSQNINNSNTNSNINTTNTNNNTNSLNPVTPIIQSPQINTSTAGSSSVNNSNLNNLNNEIPSHAFENLLNHVIQSTNNNNNDNIYLDDIPLYGKGSTIELLGLKVNLEDGDY